MTGESLYKIKYSPELTLKSREFFQIHLKGPSKMDEINL